MKFRHISAIREARAIGLGLAFALALSPVTTQAQGQADLLRTADKTNQQGDVDSEDRAVEKGFQALNDLASLNIGGAIYHGTQAYHSYNHSVEFERLADENAKRKNTLLSTGREAEARRTLADNLTRSQRNNRILSNFDRRRLYEGAIGEAAAQAEKIFGTTREKMWDIAMRVEDRVWTAVETKEEITGAKILAEAKPLVALIPNETARSNIESALGQLTPELANAGLEKLLAERPTALAAGGDPGANNGIPAAPEGSPGAIPGNTAAPSPSPPSTAEALAPPSEAESLAINQVVAKNNPTGFFIGLHDDAPEKLLGRYLATEELTLFGQIKRQTRKFHRTLLFPAAATAAH
jgi:hypothetical protein